MIASLSPRASALVVALAAFAAPAFAMESQQVPGVIPAPPPEPGDVVVAAVPAGSLSVAATVPAGSLSVETVPTGSVPDETVASGPVPAGARSKPPGFLARQLDYPRVQRAFRRKAGRVEAALGARGVEDIEEVFFRVFKREQELEVWAREPGGTVFTLVKSYPVCEVSGRLGPKRAEGDLQVPEGFYSIDTFNPWSRFHLSMRVDYPNAVDQARGGGSPLGGDIYIHGGCATIGCVPVTDEYIEELYLVAAAARDAGQNRIPVHIFPTRLDDAGVRWLAETYGHRSIDYPFWLNLQQGYLAFERARDLPAIGHDDDRYTFAAPPITRPVQSVRPARVHPIPPRPDPKGQ